MNNYRVCKSPSNWGFINNLFKVLPLNAKQYIGFLNFKGSLYNDSCYLTDAQKEMIGIVVSSYNCCTYCLQTHGDNLRGMWQNASLVDKLSGNFRACKDELSRVDYALCEYAWFVTAHPRDIDGTQIDKLREVGLDDHQILEAAFVAGFFNYTRDTSSTTEISRNNKSNLLFLEELAERAAPKSCRSHFYAFFVEMGTSLPIWNKILKFG